MKNSYENIVATGSGVGVGIVVPEDIKLLQEKLFENLSYLADFLDSHGLSYCLSAGTCLGAVRDHDFIPWDDDLDVAMLRKDFDKLFEIWESEGDKERFTLCRTTDDFCAGVPIGLLRNNNTTYIRTFEKNNPNVAHGVKIDIEPYDEISDGKIRRKLQKTFGQLYSLFLTQRRPNQCSKLMRLGASFLLNIFRGKFIRNLIIRICGKQAMKYNNGGHEKIAINGVDGIMYKQDILNSSSMLFHGKMFRVPGRYHDYLCRYGDYMQKPTVENRTPKDTPAFYDLNKPFEEYRGVKF